MTSVGNLPHFETLGSTRLFVIHLKDTGRAAALGNQKSSLRKYLVRYHVEAVAKAVIQAWRSPQWKDKGFFRTMAR